MFASIYIPEFQVQSLLRNEPDLLGKAIAVVDGIPPLLKVVSVNAAAISAGVEVGMAKLKVEHFFDVTIRQRSPSREQSAHDALLDCASAFSPRVEDTSTDVVVIDLEGLERLFGSYHQVAAQIYDRAILVGLQPNVAVAVNPDAAIHAARGFKGIVVIPRGGESSRLAELPIEVLTSPPEFLETLHRWGVHTFGAFAQLPVVKVSERLGQEGVKLHQLARGTAARPINPHRESLRFEEALELEHSIALLEPLTFVLSRLLDQVCRRLRVRSRATHEVRLKMDLEPRGAVPHERVVRLPLPVCDAKLLLKLLMLDLESNPPEAAVVKVHIEAVPTRPRTVQNGLFAPIAPEPEKLQLTLARIGHVVGRENVGSAELLDTYRPDSFVIKPFATAAVSREQPHEAQKSSLAFRQFRPAADATVQLRDGIPKWIAFQGVFGPITVANGPWYSSGDWWREERWGREEWDVGVNTRNGFAVFRIYCDSTSGLWFVAGAYD